ncbi:glyoxylase-like metal-dependent hydrolase (beta-lactamase superfamily II) [Propionicimonas paludicola]|uniref:Glyoxylase-like metal-dependent hydrolase (Beta-lactamase superfamily II) n=1 Tax=Propionicimonas paludicola TaxID=185243 RepID=A0A2A9CRL9_9ACTN|nr:MBL fold metallo-hydrolase [Propionicimonas paludicola]PFG16735.1 glyoxylase-like metal-dependent hydrolase (beta-lactamase superfamily II) [Propionicimonas paludicola]
MFLASFPSGAWQANCYLIAAAEKAECVVIDPGQDAAAMVARLVAEHGLVPSAVLATHGHFDHVADAAQVADSYGIPVYIHPSDRHLLADPAAGLDPGGAALVRNLIGAVMAEPAEVRPYPDGMLAVAGLEFEVLPAPGHTAGSVLLWVATDEHPGVERIAFTGDVVFAGSVGRTDLPGGDQPTMLRSLREVVLTLPDRTALLPGHGPQTSLANERLHNPCLQPDFLRN